MADDGPRSGAAAAAGGAVEVQLTNVRERLLAPPDEAEDLLKLLKDAKLKCIENILILSGDHLYRLDYMDFVQKHVDSGTGISVACVPTDESRASDFGLMKADRNGRITDFLIKPNESGYGIVWIIPRVTYIYMSLVTHIGTKTIFIHIEQLYPLTASDCHIFIRDAPSCDEL